jgi:amino acid adenylation domain-containing protein
MFNTGDVGRRRPDGTLEFLNRRDYQVKVRGFRVEPGEVEALLNTFAGVRESAVVPRQDAGGYQSLVAYVVRRANVRLDAAELRGFLQKRAPDYMVPRSFVLLDELPLTPTGKLDRRALLNASEQGRRSEAPYEAPRTAVEEVVAGIWAEVLKQERVGVNDNFFALGGHSLIATQVVSRLRDAFDVELPLRSLFAASTVAELSKQIEDERRAARGIKAGPIVRVPRDKDLALSFAQQRLWFLQELEPQSVAYTVPAVVQLDGELDLTALEQSFTELKRRHEILRTTFKSFDGRPVQVVASADTVRVPVVDLEELDAVEKQLEVRRLVECEALRPFNLSSGPLMRLALVRVNRTRHVLVLLMHHIISDGWSVGVLVRELATLYNSFSTGEPSPLPELPIQYVDFASWQRRHLQGESLDRLLDYWRGQLRDAPSELSMPTDRLRPSVQTFNGATTSLQLSKDLTDSIRRLSHQESATEFMVLMGAFQTLLSRYARQTDISVGTPIAGRTSSETESLIGCFINTLVLRTDLSGNPSFRELLRRIREVTFGAYENQDLPFEFLVEELRPKRLLSSTPFFQVMFILQNTPREGVKLGGLQLKQLSFDTRTAKFDLTLGIGPTPEGLMATLEYNTDLFDDSTAARLLQHFRVLLEAIVADPDREIQRLPLLTAEEHRQIIYEWNETDRDFARGRCIHHLFERQASIKPDSVAIDCRTSQLTYCRLNWLADSLASRLRRLGVGAESRVGILTGRSAQMVVGMLGVLKAGAAYVPLDPSYPRPRLHLMADDAGLSVLISERQQGEHLSLYELEVIYLDDLLDESCDERQEAADSYGDERNLAYLIYTSGTTGRPKGVAIEHASVVALAEWAAERYSREELGGMLATTSICFDLSVFEILVTVCLGGRVLLRESVLEEGASEGAVVINTVPSAMRELVRVGGVSESVRTVNLAGEALGRGLVEEVYEMEQIERVVNLYGPSEDTTYSTMEEVRRTQRREPAIGRPISGKRVYILDERMEGVPVGVVGEVYIGGEGVARGYYGKAEQTAERFVPEEWGREGGRMYRTGDLGRYLEDGRIEYVGRADQQVKVRGYRIELGEVESVLSGGGGVSEAVVVVKGEGADKRLLAFVVMKQGASNEVKELRRYLKERLPEYMVPGAIIELEQMPLTPNGKVDRRKLAGTEVEAEMAKGYVAPRNEVEEVISQIWCEVLGVGRVSIEESFFDLGGHSLLATQVVARVEEALGVKVLLRVFFEGPTVAALAETVEALRWIYGGTEHLSAAEDEEEFVI